MTKETGYHKMRAKYERMVKEAQVQFDFSGAIRDKEHLEYLEGRFKRYKL